MYTILLYDKFLKTKNKQKFITAHSDNYEFMKLLYAHLFTYPKISFPDLPLTKLQKNTINKFYDLALQFRFKNIEWNEFFKQCDVHSYNIYKQILSNPLKLNCEMLPDLKIPTFKIQNKVIEGQTIEEHNKGRKINIIKYKNDIFYIKGNKYYYSETINLIINKVFKEFNNLSLYGFYNKNKISLFDIKIEDNQIKRAKFIATKYYQNEAIMKKIFSLPTHQKVNYNFEQDKIYLVKTESKEKIINKIKLV